MWGPPHCLPSAFPSEPDSHIPGHTEPHSSHSASANCPSQSFCWSLSPFLSVETKGTRKSQISRAEGPLKKDAVSREEYGYKQFSGNTVLGVCTWPLWNRNHNSGFVPAALYCLLWWAILIYADVKEMCQGCSACSWCSQEAKRKKSFKKNLSLIKTQSKAE